MNEDYWNNLSPQDLEESFALLAADAREYASFLLGKDGRPLRILIVEDNVDSADSLNLLLRLYGHDVQVARTGPMALDMASASRPDVVLLDIGLPGMDGYEVARRLREKPEFKTVTLCALTGYTQSEADRQRQQLTGFDHYYVKPVSLETLLELFKTVERQQTSQEAGPAGGPPGRREGLPGCASVGSLLRQGSGTRFN